MAFTFYSLLEASLLILNAIAVLHEERFLAKGMLSEGLSLCWSLVICISLKYCCLSAVSARNIFPVICRFQMVALFFGDICSKYNCNLSPFFRNAIMLPKESRSVITFCDLWTTSFDLLWKFPPNKRKILHLFERHGKFQINLSIHVTAFCTSLK